MINEKNIIFILNVRCPCKPSHFNLKLADLTSVIEKALDTRDTVVSLYKITENMFYDTMKELEEI